MNGRSEFSPVSNDGSDWSGLAPYGVTDPPQYSPAIPNHRGNLATPPVSGISNGNHSRGMSNGMGRGPAYPPGNPSPPNSVARSSYATSISDGQRRKTMMMEESLAQHYSILKRYLAQSLRDEKGNPKPTRARDKLLRLSRVQFQELSTDVYDELLRRQSASGQQMNAPGQIPPYLLPRDSFHPKRNQARQKLATLPPPRFRDLATDVFYELERRFPHFAAGGIHRNGSPGSAAGPPSRQGTPNGMRPGSGRGPGSGYGPPRNASLGSQVMAGLGIPGVSSPDDNYGRPTAKTFQSNTIIPNKSTMVEDDDDSEANPDSRSPGFSRRNTASTFRSVTAPDGKDRAVIANMENQAAELQEKIADLETEIRGKDSQLTKLYEAQREHEKAGAEREEWANLRSDLESKLASALNLNNSLQSELERNKKDHSDHKQQMKSQMDEIMSKSSNADDEWKMRYDKLDKAHQQLQADLAQQHRVTEEVKQNASTYLDEMKTLSERSALSYEREESMAQQLLKLENEMKQWKSRYTRARTQLRTERATSVGLPGQDLDVRRAIKNGDLNDSDGLVRDVHVQEFHVGIDELLRAVRMGDPPSVLPHVRSIAIAIRKISQDVSKPASEDDQSPKILKMKTKLANTGNNLITASKNFASSNGLSPVSLLDAAASHVSCAVLELVRLVKVRPTPAEELEEDDGNSVIAESPTDYYGISHTRTNSGGDSIYSSMSSPRIQQAYLQSDNPVSKSARSTPNGVLAAPNAGYDSTGPAREIEGLKTFLESQTETLVSTIQSLVDTVRSSTSPPSLTTHHLSVLTATISEITATTTSVASSLPSLRKRTDSIIAAMQDCREKLERAGKEVENANGAELEGVRRKLPPVAFEVARQTKELVARVEGMGEQG